MNKKKKYLVSKVADWLSQEGYEAVMESPGAPGDDQPDAVFERGDEPLVVLEAKVVGVYRSQVFSALVGDAILRFKHARAHGRSREELMIGMLVHRLGKAARKSIERYAQEFMPELNWFLLDDFGNAIIRFHGSLHEREFADPLRHEGQGPDPSRSKRLFSYNHQWLLKVLLLSGLDRRYWGGGAQAPKSISELAEVSRIPQPSVSNFCSSFESAGFLERSRKGFKILRHVELIEDWYFVQKYQPREAVSARPLYGNVLEDEMLQKVRQVCCDKNQEGRRPPLVLGHHLACHLMGVGRSNVRAVKIYSDQPLDQVMSELDLVRDESNEYGIDVVGLSMKNFVILRGHVDHGGVPVSDILQCYLDVRSSRARGEEQADYILNEVLMPYFRRSQ